MGEGDPSIGRNIRPGVMKPRDLSLSSWPYVTGSGMRYFYRQRIHIISRNLDRVRGPSYGLHMFGQPATCVGHPHILGHTDRALFINW